MVVWYGTTILLEIIVYSTQSICSSSLIILFPNVNLVFVLSHQRKFRMVGTTIPLVPVLLLLLYVKRLRHHDGIQAPRAPWSRD